VAARELRVAFFGTPDFALPTFERLLATRHRVVAAVSQPDRPRGRGRKLEPSPIAQRALAAGVPLLRPERVADALPELVRAAPDVGVVVAYGQFLPKSVRELPACGYCINAHGSLLPRWRGAAPIARAILAGDATTGISVMRVEREMDAGAVAWMHEVPILERESCGDLSASLAAIAADGIETVLGQIAADTVKWLEQDATRATFAPKLERDEARLRWDEPAAALARRVRAFAPSPGAFTSWRGEPLRILAARALPGPAGGPPGRVQRAGGDGLRVATGDGWLEPAVLQRPGRQPLEAKAFLRGCEIPDGAQLGAEPQAGP
jgi:methionyl-tRNA formyltransferase